MLEARKLEYDYPPTVYCIVAHYFRLFGFLGRAVSSPGVDLDGAMAADVRKAFEDLRHPNSSIP